MAAKCVKCGSLAPVERQEGQEYFCPSCFYGVDVTVTTGGTSSETLTVAIEGAEPVDVPTIMRRTGAEEERKRIVEWLRSEDGYKALIETEDINTPPNNCFAMWIEEGRHRKKQEKEKDDD